MSPGKQASHSEAAAAMTAGARLEAMRRRVRLSRVAVWTVIAAGPIAVASTPTTVAAAPAAVLDQAPTPPRRPLGSAAGAFAPAAHRTTRDATDRTGARRTHLHPRATTKPQNDSTG
ncbi:hypothetical protein ACWDA7_52650 [Streptomyces sp. NPDC001156]